MLSITILISFFAVVASGIWVLKDPKFDSWVALLSSLTVFIGLFVAKKSNKSSENGHNQNMKVSNGFGIQAGRDVNLGKNKNKGNP